MSRLWDRGEPLNRVVERFTVGKDPELDQQLVAYDALASAAHAMMLEKIGIISSLDRTALIAELKAIAALAEVGSFTISFEEEDGHTAIENHLTAKLGDVGRRIHTGRSRNDQVIAALRLFGREALLEIISRLTTLIEHLILLADRYRNTSMPGYSHTRQAMPTTMGHFFAAHAELLLDDFPWLTTAYQHLNRSPLGSASGFGVPLPLDRQLVADLLGFDCVQMNTLAVQNDRGKTEFMMLGALLAPAQDLGRLATDLIWFSSDELGYLRLSSQVTTGSSIMPQKRNPDVLELVRASAALLRARHAEIGAIYGPLFSGYQRDLQLTKAPFIEGFQCTIAMFTVLQPVLETIEVDVDRCRNAILRTTGATDAVYHRVAQGEPFRQAYRMVAADPEHSVDQEPSDQWKHRTHLGAPGNLDLIRSRQRLQEINQWLIKNQTLISRVWDILK